MKWNSFKMYRVRGKLSEAVNASYWLVQFDVPMREVVKEFLVGNMQEVCL